MIDAHALTGRAGERQPTILARHRDGAEARGELGFVVAVQGKALCRVADLGLVGLQVAALMADDRINDMIVQRLAEAPMPAGDAPTAP